MPLETEVLRDGETLKIWSLGYFALSAMYTAALKDSVPNQKGLIAGDNEKTFGDLEDGQYIDFSMCPIYYLDIPKCPLVSRGEQTLKNDYTFRSGDDVIEFKKGDILHAWRTYKS